MNNDELLRIARERMAEAYEADLPNRDRDLDDRKFTVGDQWPEHVRRERENEGKPCLTINGLPQYVRQVTGQIRQLNPAIKVSPADGSATPEIAEIIEGMTRHIEAHCDAQSIYEYAAECAATGGIGYFRARTDYESWDSFDQEILIERIHNPFAVFFDPLAKDPTRKDARYVFLAEDIDLDDFKEMYPKARPHDATSDHNPPNYTYWLKGDNVTVAEYMWVEHDEVTLWDVGGAVVTNLPEGFPTQGLRTRKAKRPKVMWAKVSLNDVLEGPQELPCSSLPVFAVTGEEIHIGEEVYRSGVIRHAKDSQTLYNYARSALAEMVALQPRAPFLVTAKQVQGLERFWNEANKSNRPYLPYNPDEKAPGAPQRMQPPVSSQGLINEIQLSAEDMKRTTGIYDASLGARSNETSGVAIAQRQQEAQVSTSIYADNLVKAVTQCGKVIVEMIPRIYDTRRVVRILGEDDTEKQVVINDLLMGEMGPVPQNDITIGRYDVRVSVGPTYSTKRQEASEGMMAFLQAVPAAAGLTADLVAAAQEWPDADQFAERLKKMLPPGVADDEGAPEQQAMQMQVQQQVEAQLQEIVPQLQQEVLQSAEARKADAEAREAEADAAKAEAEAMEARLKLAAMQRGILPQQGVI
jgi:hypothetical protein